MIPSSNDSNPSSFGQPGTSSGQSPHRSLNEDVLQSAEDAVTSASDNNYISDYAGQSRADYGTRTGGVGSGYTGTVGGDSDSGMRRLGMGEGGAGFFSRMESQVTRYVSQQPAKAAMLAAGAGALLALIAGNRGKSGNSGKGRR